MNIEIKIEKDRTGTSLRTRPIALKRQFVFFIPDVGWRRVSLTSLHKPEEVCPCVHKSNLESNS
jgi:hypothetical protein